MDSNQKKIKEGQMTEKIAEHQVSAKLISKKIITAKPCVDINGADFLAIMEIKDGAKFARIQCKGITLKTPKSNRPIIIKKLYIKGTFTCFVHIRCDFDNSEHLFCFFAHDIKSREDLWKESGEKLRASFYGNSFKEKYRLFRFTDSRVNALKEMIETSDMNKEFYYSFAAMEGVLPAMEITGSISDSD
jgi:hypothetical protein